MNKHRHQLTPALKADAEYGAVFGAALRLDAATHELSHALYNGEAQAGAGLARVQPAAPGEHGRRHVHIDHRQWHDIRRGDCGGGGRLEGGAAARLPALF